jgi:hypothetical protein
MVIVNKIYNTMVTCLSEELTCIGLALRHLAPVEGILINNKHSSIIKDLFLKPIILYRDIIIIGQKHNI